MFCFDVEVCVPDGHAPVLATALTPKVSTVDRLKIEKIKQLNDIFIKAWYSWCSYCLVDPDLKPNGELTPDCLIPIRLPDILDDRLVIGHNISYDRARSLEEYDIQQNRTKFKL